jgi:hypothetical protein
MKFVMLFLIFFPTVGISQTIMDSIPIDKETGNAYYEKVIDIPGSKDDLFAKGKLWFVNSFKSLKDAIQSEDKEEGFIIAKGNFLFSHPYYSEKKKQVQLQKNPWPVRAEFTLRMYFKDNKVKIVFTDIKFLDPSNLTFLDAMFSQVTLELTKKKLTGDVRSQAAGATEIEKYRSANETLKSFISQIETHMKKKSESDF